MVDKEEDLCKKKKKNHQRLQGTMLPKVMPFLIYVWLWLCSGPDTNRSVSWNFQIRPLKRIRLRWRKPFVLSPLPIPAPWNAVLMAKAPAFTMDNDLKTRSQVYSQTGRNLGCLVKPVLDCLHLHTSCIQDYKSLQFQPLLLAAKSNLILQYIILLVHFFCHQKFVNIVPLEF